MSPDFQGLTEPLASGVRDHLGKHLPDLPAHSVDVTVRTNSSLVERRGVLLLKLLYEREIRSVRGLDLLDIGCGFGALSLFFASRGARVTAVDSNGPRMDVGREIAVEHGLAVRFVRQRMQALDALPESSFDLAVVNNALCYLIDPADRDSALREVHRVLRPGGTLIVRDPNRWHPVDPFTKVPALHLLPPRGAQAVGARLAGSRSLTRLTSAHRARRDLRRAGFESSHHVAYAQGVGRALEPFARYHHVVATRAAPSARE